MYIPAMPPIPLKSTDEYDNSPAPKSIGMYEPKSDPMVKPAIAKVFWVMV